MGASSGLRNGLRQPRTLVAERVFGRREPNLNDQVIGAVTPFRLGANHVCRNRKAAWPQSAPGGRLRCQTRRLFLLGTGVWSPRSLTGPNTGSIQAARLFRLKSKP